MKLQTGVDVSTESSRRQAHFDDERLRAVGAFICQSDRRVKVAATLCRSDAQGCVQSEVHGASMGSVIPHGSRIRIDFGAVPYEPGRVIAFFSAGKVVVHRVRWRGRFRNARRVLITQGDALRLPDRAVEIATVVGTVIAVDSGAGWQPVRAKLRLPRRDRFLSFIVFVLSVALLETDPRWARGLLRMLNVAESRYAWTRAILY